MQTTEIKPVSSEPAVEIVYDEQDFETLRYVVMVNGREYLRFNTYSKAENAISWHRKNNSLPTWEAFDHEESLEYSHISQENNGDIEKKTYSYSVDGNVVCLVEIDLYAGTWYNGDCSTYINWRDAGQAYYRSENRFKKNITECGSLKVTNL
jgi:hypothetical protein